MIDPVAERIARHLFDVTPALSDREEALNFCRGAAIKFVKQFREDALILRRENHVVDFKSLAAGERDDDQ